MSAPYPLDEPLRQPAPDDDRKDELVYCAETGEAERAWHLGDGVYRCSACLDRIPFRLVT